MSRPGLRLTHVAADDAAVSKHKAAMKCMTRHVAARDVCIAVSVFIIMSGWARWRHREMKREAVDVSSLLSLHLQRLREASLAFLMATSTPLEPSSSNDVHSS